MITVNMANNENTTNRKVLRIVIIILLIIFGFFFFIYALFHYGMSFGTFSGKSFDECNKRVQGRFYNYELPEGAEDFRFICHNYGVGANSSEAFTLQGSEYDEFIDEVKKKKPGTVSGYHDKLDFTGMKVSETTGYYDNYGEYYGFPIDNIKYVIDDDINNYTILYYDAYDGAGSTIHAIVTNPVTGRILIYNYGCN